MNRSRLTSLASLVALGAIPLVAFGCAADATGEGAAAEGSEISVAPPATGGTGTLAPPSTGGTLAPPSVTTLSAGSGWSRIHVAGMGLDGATAAPVVVDGDYWVISGRASIPNVGLPAKTAAALTQSMTATPALRGDHELIFFPKAISDSIEAGVQGTGVRAQYSCSDTSGVLSKTYGYGNSYSTTKTTDSDGFVGSATFNAQLGATVTGALSYTIKKVWCFPYPVLHNVSVTGNAGVTAGATIDATFTKQYDFSTQIAEPVLGTITLPIVPIPITFSLPVTVGVDAAAKAEFHAAASVGANATFNVTCTSNGCDGSKSASAGFTANKPPTASLTGRVTVTPWAQVDVKAYILSDSILSAKIGVRAGMPADLFGYAGNTCGDADNDGKPEFVAGATFDANIDVSLRASGTVLGSNIGSETWDLWKSHAAFWTIYNDGLLDPMFYSDPRDGTTGDTMRGRMRPCWPYSDSVNYKITWDDGSTNALTDPPATLWSQRHVFGWYGVHNPIALEAINDSAGRTLDTTATRSLYLSPVVVVAPPNGGVFTQ